MARTKIRSIGNSRGIVIPADLLEEMGLSESDEVEIVQDADRIIVRPSAASRRDDFIRAMEEVLHEDDKVFEELAKV